VLFQVELDAQRVVLFDVKIVGAVAVAEIHLGAEDRAGIDGAEAVGDVELVQLCVDRRLRQIGMDVLGIARRICWLRH
jgi:hypothetical protein